MRLSILLALWLALIACLSITTIECAKILSIFSIPSPSHYIFAGALLKELAARGHDVTSITVYPQKQPLKNFRDIFIETNINILEEVVQEAEQGIAPTDEVIEGMKTFTKITQTMSINILEHPEVQKLLKNSTEYKFDLIIIENIFSQALFGLGEHFNAPTIGVSTFGTILGLDDAVGNSSPSSVTPNNILTYSSEMNFIQRIRNFITNTKQYFAEKIYNYPVQQQIYNKFFPNAKLSLDEAFTSCSLFLLNQHHTLSYPRLYVPNAIEVGGLHIPHNPPPLPADMQQFLDNATEGVVYFSLGSNTKSKDIPIEKRNILLKVFSELKQKVLWKFEDPELPGKPDNVFITKWAPQHSILAHPNVRVFFTHGGLLSTTEAIFYGKPILGMPIWAEQPRNIALAKKKGVALSIDFVNFTEEDLRHVLNELLYNPIYAKAMKDLSSQYHDKPMTAMETAVYWVEYVLRHNGAKHLRNAGVNLNILQYYSIDVISILLAAMALAVGIVYYIIRKLVLFVIGSTNTPKVSSKRKTG